MSWMTAFQNNVHNVIAIVFTVTVSCPTLRRGKGQWPTQQCCSRNSSLLPPTTISHSTPSVGRSDKVQQLTCTNYGYSQEKWHSYKHETSKGTGWRETAWKRARSRAGEAEVWSGFRSSCSGVSYSPHFCKITLWLFFLLWASPFKRLKGLCYEPMNLKKELPAPWLLLLPTHKIS